MTTRDKDVEALDSLVSALRAHADTADKKLTDWCLGFPAAARALDAELRVLESKAAEARGMLRNLEMRGAEGR
jgi:hypothetical protein